MQAPRWPGTTPTCLFRINRLKESDMKTGLSAIVWVIALALAAGCGTTEKAGSRKAMEDSLKAYEKCLEQNPADPSKCEALKRAFKTEYEAYRRAGSNYRGPIFTGFFEFGFEK